uniref:Uncharacterized protein n=1 Tax=Solanum lycopersicum TaxID=4081 RepID=K4C494_SOLLC
MSSNLSGSTILRNFVRSTTVCISQLQSSNFFCKRYFFLTLIAFCDIGGCKKDNLTD